VQYSPLKFICPVNGKQVDTDIDLDEDSFASLHDPTELGCPHCTDPHRLDNVQSWLGVPFQNSSDGFDALNVGFGRRGFSPGAAPRLAQNG
jgi:hypothetical protein